MNCTNLVELRMGNNNLGDDISMLNFPKLSQLSKLGLRKNYFSSILPRSIYSCKFLKAVQVNYNNVEVQIQPEILSFKSLSFLALGRNKGLTNVTGVRKCRMVLKWLSNLKKLQLLNLSHNRITGLIPSWLGTFPKLQTLLMQANQLSGEFPKELCTLPMLVSGQTTSQVGLIYLELPVYSNADAAPLQFLYVYSSFINLSHNCLGGNIPIEIGQLQLLLRLDLSANNFSSNIPDQISNIKYMERLDLSMNHLLIWKNPGITHRS
ncbi:putative leucine-rich repeat domain, L domain-containing protein [Rosa chinensis]|uniref:Putative leucine-rich repeat domain, L domain-containing protein n=1 Tax=Rosa chinensis TaxID=74649 RepID=A0A2P6QNE4_ROSCH|nr:putative leucine-rich repeat domain, L domain-containing protein [Rosa chinensis]